ncbi:MAG: sn-glycerol-1-phosphate dehydrogenase [Myxococcota bacterium]|nr:sn-glycerol-1-phosphate dehydrogenase [Myxococcota bacterium]
MNDAANAQGIPEQLDDLLGFSTDCTCGRTHSVDLSFAAVRQGAIDDVVLFARELGRGSRVLIVADAVTNALCGEQVRQLLVSDGYRPEVLIIPNGPGNRPHADTPTLARVTSSMPGMTFAVSVGSGTINDLTKLSAFDQGIPYISVATAPSMNGYTSSIAAILRDGVKQTIPCRQPIAIVADLDILSRAPHHLIGAGLGDLESKPTATADFRLGGFLNKSYYCAAPEKVVLLAEARVADTAKGLSTGDPDAMAALTEALLLSGISMTLAGSSGPASGGEHLISHFWDMTAEEEGRVEGWHGAQVGVATIVTSALYERLAALLPQDIDIERIIAERPHRRDLEQAIEHRHGARAQAVVKTYFSKHLEDDALVKELEHIRDHWSDLWATLAPVLRPSSQIRNILLNGDAATRVSDLDLTRDHLERAFIAAREIRDRYTVLDFAADLGVLYDLRSDVLNKSHCLE